MVSKIFVNLPVKDLKKSMAFFRQLGFDFNMDFTNDDGACMVLSQEIFVMLLMEPYFKTFIKKEIADTKKSAAAIFAIELGSKTEVDELTQKAINAGGKKYNDPKDHGFMYQTSFEDLDGHLWEVFVMDPTAIAKN